LHPSHRGDADEGFFCLHWVHLPLAISFWCHARRVSRKRSRSASVIPSRRSFWRSLWSLDIEEEYCPAVLRVGVGDAVESAMADHLNLEISRVWVES